MSNTPQVLNTENIETTETGAVFFDGPEAVNVYAFLMLRSSVIMRVKHGRSMLRNKEAVMAYNYGWSEKTRWSKGLLAELNAIGDAAGIKRSELDPTV